MYADTSVLVKLLVNEPESVALSEALADKALSTSELAWTEVWSALLSKERAGQLAARDRERAWHLFTGRIRSEALELLPLNGAAIRRAREILASCHPSVPLRTLDALHVAACDLSQDFPLCTTDRRMRDAAAHLHMPVFP